MRFTGALRHRTENMVLFQGQASSKEEAEGPEDEVAGMNPRGSRGCLQPRGGVAPTLGGTSRLVNQRTLVGSE